MGGCCIAAAQLEKAMGERLVTEGAKMILGTWMVSSSQLFGGGGEQVLEVGTCCWPCTVSQKEHMAVNQDAFCCVLRVLTGTPCHLACSAWNSADGTCRALKYLRYPRYVLGSPLLICLGSQQGQRATARHFAGTSPLGEPRSRGGYRYLQ